MSGSASSRLYVCNKLADPVSVNNKALCCRVWCFRDICVCIPGEFIVNQSPILCHCLERALERAVVSWMGGI